MEIGSEHGSIFKVVALLGELGVLGLELFAALKHFESFRTEGVVAGGAGAQF